MQSKPHRSGLLVTLCAAIILTGCGAGTESSADADATIAAYQTRVASLEEENERLSTAVADLSPAPEREIDPAKSGDAGATSPVQIGDDTAVAYGTWQIRFTGYTTSTELRLPSEDHGFWEADDEFHIITASVENTSRQSAPFPRFDFTIVEEYGASFNGSGFFSSDPLVDDEQMLIPGNTYELWLVFDVPEEASGLRLVSDDGRVVVDLAAYDLSATPVPDSVSRLGDGTVVTYDDWSITFDDMSWLRGSQNDDFLDVTITVTNTGSSSRTFPFKDFEIIEQYGSSFSPFMLDFPESGDMFDSLIDAEDEELLPNRSYELVLEFAVSKGSEGLVLRSQDGSVVVMLDGD